jgi:hypothetical protein
VKRESTSGFRGRTHSNLALAVNRPSASSNAACAFKGVLEKTLLRLNVSRLRVNFNMPREVWKVRRRGHDQILSIWTTEGQKSLLKLRPLRCVAQPNEAQMPDSKTHKLLHCAAKRARLCPICARILCQNLSTNLPPKPSTRRTRCCIWPTAHRIIHFPKYTD